MRWKSALTVLLAVFLQSATSWAAVCDVACLVQRSEPGCHVAQVSSHGDHLASMAHSHCAHMGRSGFSGVSAFSFVVATSSCAHSLCRQPDGLVDPAKTVQFDRVQWVAIYQASISDQSLLPTRYVSEAPPPVIPPLLDPLSVALRI